ncbi:MAG TPA: hypothetical protein VL096_03640 [Pirellulaceae bacterium]|nr:hypothetical protein [Pirellulaceae bacterium]
MSTLTPPTDAYRSSPPVDDVPVYRTLSKAALLSPILGIFALAGLAFPSLLVLAVAGFALALVGLSSIRRYPDEYSGRWLAITGLVFCSLLAIGGTTMHAVEYATEVPEGYQRISFYDLNPEDPKAPALPPPGAVALNGQQVFIKGYVFPDGQGDDIKQFVMIPDLKTCCFGGQPKLTDMILVTLREPHRTVYNQRRRKLTGVLKVNSYLHPVSGVTGVFYELDAESIQ